MRCHACHLSYVLYRGRHIYRRNLEKPSMLQARPCHWSLILMSLHGHASTATASSTRSKRSLWNMHRLPSENLNLAASGAQPLELSCVSDAHMRTLNFHARLCHVCTMRHHKNSLNLNSVLCIYPFEFTFVIWARYLTYIINRMCASSILPRFHISRTLTWGPELIYYIVATLL
jgi:hypothetical protein